MRFREIAKLLFDPDEAIEFEKELEERHGRDIDSADWMLGFLKGAIVKYRQLLPEVEP
jgi:hypothetical protein